LFTSIRGNQAQLAVIVYTVLFREQHLDVFDLLHYAGDIATKNRPQSFNDLKDHSRNLTKIMSSEAEN